MASQRRKSKEEVEFSWTVDEFQLVLQAAPDHKAKCEFKAENWEKKRQKHKDIFDILMKEYPDEKEKYPNKEKMGKNRAAAKLKSIRSGFKKAIDCGKKSGWGSAVFTFFDFCNDLWVGCPAFASIQNCITLRSNFQMTPRIRFHPLVLALYSILQMLKIFQMKKKVRNFRTNRKFLNVKGKMTLMLTTQGVIPRSPTQDEGKSRKC